MNISNELQKARDFEARYMHYADAERPAFHVTGAIGWINDPNGFSVYKGEYHLFFQYHPYSTVWGPMHWGHVKTSDFIHWEHLPVALAPDTEADRNGCFSGSAIELPDGRQLLMYTGVYKVRRDDAIMQDIQHQCVAVGDGVNYEKFCENPVLDASDLPEGGSAIDFRDPKIWREDDTYYAVIGNRTTDGSGDILMFESQDGFHWHYTTTLERCENVYGKMWECPDFFALDDKHLILTSPQEMVPLGLEFHAGFGTIALLGTYDKQAKHFERECVQAIDYGIDFYAPQTMETADGRRVMIAWMRNWTTVNCQPQNIRLFGSMTLPRELSVRDNRLIQNPVRELEQYRTHHVSYKNLLIQRETNINGVHGRRLDLTVTVRPATEKGYDWFKLKLAKDGEHSATIRYKPDCSTVRIDRTRSGGRFDIVHVRDFLVRHQEGVIKLRVIVDTNSVELFVNDGEQAATFLLYSPITADAITFEANTGVMIDVDKYDIEA